MNRLDRQDQWFESGVHVKLKQPSHNRGGCLRHHLSATYDVLLKSDYVAVYAWCMWNGLVSKVVKSCHGIVLFCFLPHIFVRIIGATV